MKLLHQRFGPRYSDHERIVYGSTNRTGHAGCWINDSACEAPDCIMADIATEPTAIEVEGTVVIVKRCSCGREYTRAQWDELDSRGRFFDSVELVELRQCVCDSTIGIVVGKQEQ